jgi:colanic acid/amylovoran biosynthesis glycosyltransferase
LKIAYFVNQYPAVSLSFIRREILALERQGAEILRVALRGWDLDLADEQDKIERSKTCYVLNKGPLPLVMALLQTAVTRPLKFLTALKYVLKFSFRADRPLPVHLIYLAEACRILPWLEKSEIQHIHAHFGTNSAEVVMLTYLLGGPSYSFTVHGPEEFDKTTFLYLKEKIHHASFVAAISSYTRSQLYRWADYHDWHKIHVIHCGLESSFHAVEPQPVPETPKIVCVGRLCEQKGQLLLLNAVSQLAKRGQAFELVLAGDGEMRGEIERLIAKNNLKAQVKITGWISSEQVREHILTSRALVLPSFAEGLPVVIMEALALKRPVLTTYVAGIPELVRHGESGWLFPAGDVEELTSALQELLNAPLDQLDRMGEAGYQRVIERHSIDKEAAKLKQLFEKTVRPEAVTDAEPVARQVA